MDLRQFGLLLLVSRRDHVPLFHSIYQGNIADRTIFKEQWGEMLKRFKALAGALEDITLVFDQGNNSKGTLEEVNKKLYFVGALSPYQHKDLIQRGNASLQKITMDGKEIECYSERSTIWGLDLTVVVFISEKLRLGQLRGIEQAIKKLFKKLTILQEKSGMRYSRGIRSTREYWEKKIGSLIDSHSYNDLIQWSLERKANGGHKFIFWIDQSAFDALKQKLGRRIVVTNRHNWSAAEIMAAYYGQANVEYAFKSMKNPFHLAVRPQYHWTDQKIKVHSFICLLAFLLSMIAYKKAKEKAHFTGSVHTLLEKLASIRLATFIEAPKQKRKGRYQAYYRLEEMDEELASLVAAMELSENNLKSNIPFSVYT
jgi:transposase